MTFLVAENKSMTKPMTLKIMALIMARRKTNNKPGHIKETKKNINTLKIPHRNTSRQKNLFCERSAHQGCGCRDQTDDFDETKRPKTSTTPHRDTAKF